MTSKTIFRALDGLDPDLVEQAAPDAPKHRNKRTLAKWVALAACLALMLGLLMPWGSNGDSNTGGGLLCITVYAEDRSCSVLTEDTVSTFWSSWSFTNWAVGLPITLAVEAENENISFLVRTDGGFCYADKDGGDSIYARNTVYMGEEFTVPNHTTIFWSQTAVHDPEDTFWRDGELAFVDIIVYDGERPLGYVVLRFDRESMQSIKFNVSTVAMVEFEADGDITQAYVDSCIAMAHR